jgi:GntR family transcriptional regulator, transcriptional repressor for pyruvate dehydrogenase complex
MIEKKAVRDLITPIKQKKIYLQIIEQFLAQIEDNQFKPGMQLPSERDLADTFGVSRASLREALIVLQSMGLVEARIGQGTFIVDKQANAIQLPTISFDESPFTILSARKAIEPNISALAAIDHTDETIEKLETILNTVASDSEENPVLTEVFSEGDRNFHLAIAKATENAILVSFFQSIYSLMGQKLWLALMRKTSFATPGRWQEAQIEHRGVLEAIKSRDPVQAKARMQAHLERVEYLMLEADLTSIG